MVGDVVRGLVAGVEIAALMAQVGALQAENAKLREVLGMVASHLTGARAAGTLCLAAVDECLSVGHDELPVDPTETLVLTDRVLDCDGGDSVER